jgi:UDP-3-O-[3-hydroxymyristoyl] glucosamine N-acyltransferase
MAAAALTAQAVADLVGGRLLGDGGVLLDAVASLDRAGPNSITFATGSRYRAALASTRADAVLLTEELADVAGGCRARIVVRDPARAMAAVTAALFPPVVVRSTIDPTARLGPGVSLGEGVVVGPWAVLGAGVQLGARTVVGAGVVLEDGVQVGEDCALDAHVVCYAGTLLGNRVKVKAGAVIGGIGFGFHSDRDGHERIPHAGGCRIEDDVEIGANCTIDRGSVDDTVVGAGCKLDNQVHVGHNVRMGRHCLLMGGVMIGGSTRLGHGVIVGGRAGITNQREIGDGARIGAMSPVSQDVPPGGSVSGFVARSHREILRAQAAVARLPRIIDDLERLVEARERDRDA